MPAVVQDIRKYLVEVFALVRVNLPILKGKIAGKRACWRTNLDNFMFNFGEFHVLCFHV